MMLKIWVLIMMLVVSGAAMILAPTTYAQQDTWKTYINPTYNFTIQYPQLDSNIHEGVTPNVILFNIEPYTMLQINELPQNETLREYVQNLMSQDLQSSDNMTILNEITPTTTFTNMSAFTYSIYDRIDEDSDISKVGFSKRESSIHICSIF